MTEKSFNFTVERLANLKCPNGKTRIRCHDTKVDGLTIRLRSAGSKVFSYYRRLPDTNENPRKVVDITIGNFGDVPLEEARKKAEGFNVMVGAGKDPSAVPTEQTLTYDTLFRRYIEEYAKTRTTTWKIAVYNHDKYFQRWHAKPVARIRRQDIQHWVNHLGEDVGKPTANRMYNAMRAVFSWALRKDIISGTNPCVGVDLFKLRARERFIQPGKEFEAFASALNAEPSQTIRDFFWMCLFTGARRSNVLAMEWGQIDFELMSWRIPITKNQDSLTVPLTPLAIEILRRRKDDEESHERWVFPSDRIGKKTRVLGHMVSPHKAWQRVIARAKEIEPSVQDLRIHDLRRTAGSYMAIQGISSTIIGKALGHKSPNSTAIYARLTQDPVREALQRAQEALPKPEKLLPEAAKVVDIKGGKKNKS